ncbi:MAG: tetratricopeptide repeat protein [Methanosarcina sp.]|nr:tetratricopeptide repeat protein [Methanosarcina sp.]
MLRRYFILLCVVWVFVSCLGAFADSAKSLVDRGNKEWLSGNYDNAIKSYDEAAVNAPEFPYIFFNKGAALYKKGDYQGAIEAFEKAALKSKEPLMEAKSRFNLGDCTYREAERQMDSDLKKAMELCQKSIVHYQDALKLDPSLKKAAENIEIVRLMMKNILDEIKKQQEAAKNQQQQAKENAEELQKLIKRQEEALNRNREQSKKNLAPSHKKNELDKLADEQKTISDDTQKFADKIKGQAAQQKQGEENPALTHLNNAVKEQLAAEGNLRNLNPSEAGKNQENAVKELKDALKPPEQDQKNQGKDQQKKEEQQGNQGQQGQEEQKDQDKKENSGEQPEQKDAGDKKDQQGEEEQASMQKQGVDPQDILDEESDNQKDRKLRASGGYSDVDKDW